MPSYADTVLPDIVAAGASSVAVQEAVINTTHAFLTDGLNDIPFGTAPLRADVPGDMLTRIAGTKYYVEGADVGEWIANKARSTVGSDFALLALDQGTWGTSY